MIENKKLKILMTFIMSPMIFAPTYIVIKLAQNINTFKQLTPIWWVNLAVLLCFIHSVPIVYEWPIEEIWGKKLSLKR